MTTPTESSRSDRAALLAHVVPFGLFMLGLAAVSGVKSLAGDSGHVLLEHPAYWIYPLQTLVCAVALVAYWKNYAFGSQKPLPLAIAAGIFVFGLWISPQWLFGQPARLEGFNPDVFADSAPLYWATILARFLRLVVVVPLVEEIFWRGFLMRYLVDESFTKVPFGKYTHLSFWGVTGAFALAHWGPDFIPAVLTGAIYGWIAVRTKSLLACVIAHAVTNLALGIWIMQTKQWGFW